MAPKNLLPVAALCSCTGERYASRRLGNACHGKLFTASSEPRGEFVGYRRLPTFFARTCHGPNLGMPSPQYGRLDSRGYQATGQGERPPDRLCHLHMEIGRSRRRWRPM